MNINQIVNNNQELTLTEEWKDIPNYEGYYQISNFGQVKSLKRTIISKNGVIKHLQERIITPKLQGHNYYYVFLTKESKHKKFYIHRLVAESFVNNPNPTVLIYVNHIDENKINNIYTNLEWVSNKINCNTKNRIHNITKARTGVYKQPIICENHLFSSIMECAKFYNIKQNTMNCWLCGHFQMPQEWIDKGLQYYNSTVYSNGKLNNKKDKII